MTIVLIIIVGVVLVLTLIAFLIGDSVSAQDALSQVQQHGQLVRGKLLEVDGGTRAGQNGSTVYYRVGITLEYAAPGGVKQTRTQVIVPEGLRHLMQNGAPCEARIDPNEPSKLCLISIENAFGVKSAVTLGSMYSRW